jgi:hypothetical protein
VWLLSGRDTGLRTQCGHSRRSGRDKPHATNQLAHVAALFLATGTAHADNEKWEASFRQCHIRKWFSKDELAAIGWARETEGQTIVIEAEEIPDILKAIRVIKKCKAFYQCLEDRDRGKVKHCYENDRRWRRVWRRRAAETAS